MAIIEKSYMIERGEHDSFRIVQSGRCDGDASTVASILAGCTRRYTLETIPQARGVILKPMDGTVPTIVEITPPTMTGTKFNCVKVDARCWPFAATQPGGLFSGKTVLLYEIVWQQVGALP